MIGDENLFTRRDIADMQIISECNTFARQKHPQVISEASKSGGDGARQRDGAGGFGCEASLDLIFGHLTTELRYVPVNRPFAENQPENWYRPSGHWSPSDQANVVLKIQPFKAGGYEAIAKFVCLPDLARMLDAPRKSGSREKPEHQDQETVRRSIQRSKTKVRHLIKSMGADRLLTLTKREKDPALFWTLEQWAASWSRFVLQCKRAGIEFQYVAIPELHKKGNYHLHVALCGRIHINTARRIWWAICGGHGQGNIDVKYRPNQSATERLAGLAKYLSKYLTKQFGADAFNKKRYWASRHDLPPAIRVILRALDIRAALAEFAEWKSLDFDALMYSKLGAYQFGGESPVGFWFNWSESVSKPCPF